MGAFVCMAETMLSLVDVEVAKPALVLQATVEEGLASLQARLSNLKGTMTCLPQDSIESMLSSLTVSTPNPEGNKKGEWK